MEKSCVRIMLIALLAITLHQTSGVRLVVVRDPESKSEEDDSDSLSPNESDEIDFLMDLIQNEAQDREPPPVTTVRVIKRKPDIELSAQHSVRNEKVHSSPNTVKEYHVHYHNHQHKAPPKPALPFERDPLHPMIWSSQIPARDFNFFRQVQKPIPVPFAERDRVKSFRDYDAFLKSNMNKDSAERMPPPPEVAFEAFKDFDAFPKPRIPSYDTKDDSHYDRLRKYREYFDTVEEKISLPHQQRFAAFKDFSEMENADRMKSDHKNREEQRVPEKKNVKVKDFAIVIKTRPRSQNKEQHKVYKINNSEKEEEEEEEEEPGPKIPPFVNKLRIPLNKLYDIPKVLEAPGGAPKYIDDLNHLKYPHPEGIGFPPRPPYPLNVIENEQRNFFHIRPPFPPPPIPMHHPFARYPMRPPHLNGWLLKRKSS